MKITFIGTGLLGFPMAKRLLAIGHELTVYNRTLQKAAPLADSGAEIAESPQDAIRASECIILVLTNFHAVENILFREPEILSGKTIINMSTLSPDENIDLYKKVQGCGGEYLEVPVLGSIPEAQNGTFFVMAGAEAEQFSKWLELLKCFGEDPKLIGPVGYASTLKLALNQLIASLTASFSLSLGLILNKGINTNIFMDILRKSALYAPTFDKKLKRMLDRDFSNPNFPLKHLLKDISLILETSEKYNLNTSTLEGVQNIVKHGIEMGFGESDYSSLYNAVNILPENQN